MPCMGSYSIFMRKTLVTLLGVNSSDYKDSAIAEFKIADCRLQIADCSLQDSGLQDWRLCRLQVVQVAGCRSQLKKSEVM